MTEKSVVDYEPARGSDPETSKAAADKLTRRGRMQMMVLGVFAHAGDRGATNEDVYAAYPAEREDALRPRVAELFEAGLIAKNGVERAISGEILMTIENRMGSRGRYIKVWRITGQGVRIYNWWANRATPEDGQGRKV